MRVAQIVQSLGVGGAEKLAVEIAGGLAAQGYDSHLIVLTPGGLLEETIPDSVCCHHLDLDYGSGGGTLPMVASLGRTYRRLVAITNDLRLEAVQTHLPMSNFFGLALAWSRSCRVFPTVHNNREFDYGDVGNPLRAGMRRLAYRQLLSYGTRMIAVSAATKRAMVDELGIAGPWADRKLVVVPNGVTIPESLSTEQVRAIRKQYDVPDSSVLLVGVGRLTEQKNFGDLISALTRLPDDANRWFCLIAGEGEQHDVLERLVRESGLADRVRLVGHASAVDRLLGAADVFCLPSLWEGLPLALLEALAAGIPVVANSISGVTDVVHHRRQSLLTESGDVDGLSKALLTLIQDSALRSSLGAEGRRLVECRYSFAEVTSRLAGIYGTS